MHEKATPRPWRNDTFLVSGADGYSGGRGGVAHTGCLGRPVEESEANAKLIVIAVNAYDSLIEACEIAYSDLLDGGNEDGEAGEALLAALELAGKPYDPE